MLSVTSRRYKPDDTRVIYLIITGITYRHFPSYDNVFLHDLHLQRMRENAPVIVDKRQQLFYLGINE